LVPGNSERIYNGGNLVVTGHYSTVLGHWGVQMELKDLKDLKVYQTAEELSDMIWNIVVKWDHFAKMTLGKQLVESADAICANIAEGFGRYHFKENRNFCYDARGSLEETKRGYEKVPGVTC